MVKREFTLGKVWMIVLVTIILAAGMIFPKKEVSASKQASIKVTATLKNGVFTVKGKGKMTAGLKPTSSQKKKIKKIVIKEGVTSLPEDAFKNCKKATSITIASSVKEIGKEAFSGTAIKSITIPKTVKKIGWGICLKCDSLKTMTIPGTFDVIEPSKDNLLESFVVGKKSLKTVKFSTALNPELVRMVGDCENFEVSSDDPNFKSIDGLIYTKDGKILVRIPYARTEAVVAEGCETVAVGSYSYLASGYYEPYIYKGCGALQSIVFPSSVSKVTDKVYSDHVSSELDYKEDEVRIQLNMTTLELDSIKQLWRSHKLWQKSLAGELERIGVATVTDGMVILSDGYLCGYIGEAADIVVPDEVKTIGERAFSLSYIKQSVKSIVLGSGVNEIEDYAFYLNKGIKVTIKNENVKISEKAFRDCDSYEIIVG